MTGATKTAGVIGLGDMGSGLAKNLMAEAGNGTMVNSCWAGHKLIDDLDAKGTLKILWDPANNCWVHETAWPDGTG